jgi:uncharacterized protein (TIGR02246 family)
MFRSFCTAAIVCCTGLLGTVIGEDKVPKAAVAVGELNEAYVTAFNQQNAKGIAECFREASDFTLLTGLQVQGRAALQAAHESFFQNNPGAKIEGKQETYRMIRPGIVLATGTWKVTGGPAEYPSSGLWFTVVGKQAGAWRYEAMRLMIPVE